MGGTGEFTKTKTKPTFSVSAYFALSLLLISPSLMATEPKLKYLIYGHSNSPVQIHSQDDLMQGGLLTDTIKAISDATGIAFHPIQRPPKRLAQEILRGELSHWVAYSAKSWIPEEQRSYFSFSKHPVYIHRISFVANRSQPITFNGFASLTNKRIIRVLGFSKPWLDDVSRQHQYQSLYVKSGKIGATMVARNRADGYFMDTTRMKYLFNRDLIHLKFGFSICDMTAIIPPQPVYLIFDGKVDPAIIQRIDAQMDVMYKHGEQQQIVERYSITDEQHPPCQETGG